MSEAAREVWVRFLTAEAWGRELGLPSAVIIARVAGLVTRRGRLQDGRTADCYAEHDVRRACADLIPRAG